MLTDEMAQTLSQSAVQIAAENRTQREEELKAQAEAARQAEEARKAAEEAERQAREADQRLLAALIFCEAGNQPYEGQVAVGAVVMNRVNSGAYPGSIREVIYQSGQFGACHDRMAGSGPGKWQLYPDCPAGRGGRPGRQ